MLFDDLHGLQEEMSEALVLLEVPELPEVPQVPENPVRLVGRTHLDPTCRRAGKLDRMEPLKHCGWGDVGSRPECLRPEEVGDAAPIADVEDWVVVLVVGDGRCATDAPYKKRLSLEKVCTYLRR